jgi:hypothetical protein
MRTSSSEARRTDPDLRPESQMSHPDPQNFSRPPDRHTEDLHKGGPPIEHVPGKPCAPRPGVTHGRNHPERGMLTAQMLGMAVSNHRGASSLKEPLAWANSTLVRDDAVEAVRAMKENGSGLLSTIGSLSLYGLC